MPTRIEFPPPWRRPWPWRWRRVLVETDVRCEDGPLYAAYKVRPRWYWWACRLRLFGLILWRRYEGERVGWRRAWRVARGIYERETVGMKAAEPTKGDGDE